MINELKNDFASINTNDESKETTLDLNFRSGEKVSIRIGINCCSIKGEVDLALYKTMFVDTILHRLSACPVENYSFKKTRILRDLFSVCEKGTEFGTFSNFVLGLRKLSQ